MGLLGDILGAVGFDMLRMGASGDGVACTVATGQGGAFSVSLTAADSFFKDFRRADNPGLDDWSATWCVRASALTAPIPGWITNAAGSGLFAGKWTIRAVEPAGATAGMHVLRVGRKGMRGTPT